MELGNLRIRIIFSIIFLKAKKNISNILLDINDVDFAQVDFMDRFLAGEKIAEFSKYPNAIKFAVIGPKEHCDGFVDNVATNRGALFKVFYNKSDAIKWIRE